MGCTSPEFVVYVAAWHDAWVQVANVGRREWRDGRAILAGSEALVAPHLAVFRR